MKEIVDMLNPDFWVHSLVEHLVSPPWTQIMINVTNVGGVYLPVIIVIMTAVYFIHQKDWWNFFAFFLAVGGGKVVQELLKVFFHRPRPNSHLVMANGYSFPSGHSFAAMTIYGFLSYWVWKRSEAKALRFCILLISIVLILFVGMSRVYLGVHWLTDVLGAYLVGFAWLVFSVRVVKTIKEKSREP